MPLNDAYHDEFNTMLQNEEIFDAHPPPGTEIGIDIARDYGSGSYAEDGRLEVAEDRVMSNGESQLGYGPASMYGQSEIGHGLASLEGQSEIGDFFPIVGAASAADRPGYEIGAASAADRPGYEIGAASAADRPGTEIGHGWGAVDGQSEIGDDSDIQSPFESFMLDEVRMGDDELGSAAMYGPTEIGAASAADRPGTEIGAVTKVVEKARDNRQPPPPMRAVDVDAPSVFDEDWSEELMDVIVGAAEATGSPDPFPLTTQFMQRCGAGAPPRYVRVDTEESYQQYKMERSPELAELSRRLDEHIADPHAHDMSALSDDIVEDLVHIGEEADAAAAEKRVSLWMPAHYDGLVEAWVDDEWVGASMVLPGQDGHVRICTALEPIGKCVSEMGHHAAQAGVPAAAVIGVLSEMGCVLGAGTVLKEMAAAAPEILKRPEAAARASFMVRIEPKTSPAIAALAMLAMACNAGVQQACDEWANLGALSPAPIKQAMLEAVQIAKAAM